MDEQQKELALEYIRRELARDHFAHYFSYVSGFITAKHMDYLCAALEDVERGTTDRLIICMPPGHAKSTLTSHYFAAWFIARNPKMNICSVSHTEKFAERWGRKVRNTIMTREHKLVFPDSVVMEDSRAAGQWEVDGGGEYYATGVGGTVTGRRADLIIIDDPLRGMEDAESPGVRDNMWEWYGSDLITRLKPGGRIIIIQTRWHLDDLAGRLLANEKQGQGDKWRKIIMPAIATEHDELGRKPGEPLWPDWMDVKALNRLKSQPSMTPRMWSALYQQEPTIDAGGIISRDWFKLWAQERPPENMEMVIQSWDCAISKEKSSAYTACITLGLFRDANDVPSLILLAADRWRIEYPDIRKMAQRLAFNYLDGDIKNPMVGHKARRPDMILIEDKATGKPLMADLARAGIATTSFNPQRYGDKDSRVKLCSDVLENGRVYVPTQGPSFLHPKRWAVEFIDQCVAYPASDSRDYVDTLTQVILRMKQSGFVRNTEDGYVEPRMWADDYHNAEAFY